MKKKLAALTTVLALIGMVGMANATLTTIGTASYNSSDYNLIWDDDNNGNSVIWLDYSNTTSNWAAQTTWAAGLGSILTYNIDPAYSVDWGSNPWRLPNTVDGPWVFGNDGTTTGGYNITSSEMGHLYYEELGNLGLIATDGTNPQSGWGLNNTGNFDNLIGSWYWSGTEYTEGGSHAWIFNMDNGGQGASLQGNSNYGLAVHPGQVSAVPIPGAIWLLGSGMAGLIALGRRRKGNRV